MPFDDRRTEILVVAMIAGFFVTLALSGARTAHERGMSYLASIGFGCGMALLAFLVFLMLLAVVHFFIRR
jgi:hypothetical protein